MALPNCKFSGYGSGGRLIGNATALDGRRALGMGLVRDSMGILLPHLGIKKPGRLLRMQPAGLYILQT